MLRRIVPLFGSLTLLLVTLVSGARAAEKARAVEKAPAAEKALPSAVEQLFEIGWSTSFKARAATDQQFAVVQQIEPDNPQVIYAYALIKAKQRRYDEASNLLSRLIRTGTKDPHVWQAKVWLSVLTRNFTESIVEMDQFGRQLATEPTPDAIHAAKFLGATFGYLEGPVQASVDDAIVAEHKLRMTDSLSSVLGSVFKESRQAVIDEHAKLIAERDALAAEAMTRAEEDRAKLLQELGKEEQDIATTRETLGPRRDKLTDDMNEELAEIRKEDQPLADRITELESQALVVRRDMFWVNSEMSRMHAQSQGARDVSIRDAFLRELNRLSFLSSQYQANLQALDRRATAINQQRREIQQRYQRTEASYNQRLQDLTEEAQELDRREKRLAGKRKRAEKPAKADVRRTRVLSDRAKALSTYADFPLELEKQRLLETFK